jgi:hypothetical protein
MGDSGILAVLFLRDRWLVCLPRFYPGWRSNCQQDLHDPCRGRKYAITTLFGPTPSQDPMLFQVPRYASSLDSVVNSLPQVSGCPCPSSFQENHLLILQRRFYWDSAFRECYRLCTRRLLSVSWSSEHFPRLLAGSARLEDKLCRKK